MTREEALKILKDLRKTTLSSVRTALETFIPELKESEDERIRKTLLRCCDDWEKGQFGCMKSEDVPAIRAYLEKQKYEYEVFEPVESTLEYKMGFKDGVESVKQKEQKPVTIVRIPKFRVGDIIQHVPLEKWDRTRKITSIDEHGYNFNLSHLGDTVSGGAIGFAFEDEYELVEQKEQKPTELPKSEDYGIDGLYAAVDILQKTLGEVDGYQTDDGILEHKCAISAVKGLYEQKSAEWSEEDDMLMDELESYILYDKEFNDEQKSWRIKRLKSLRSQPHWKPSEEQIGALERAIIKMHTHDDIGILAELRDNLKKL